MISSSDGAALARLYDLDLSADPGDLDLYLALAARTGGPVLELAAGSARLAVPLAAAGFEVTAVDRDPHMLARAAARWRGATQSGDVAPGGSLELIEGDLFDTDLGARFGLALLALNTLLLLGPQARQAAALAVMARHLRPGGLAVMDIALPDPATLAAYDGRLALEWIREDPGTGNHVAKVTSATFDPLERRIDLTTSYESAPAAGGPVARHVRQDELHVIAVDELLRAAAEAGLEVDALGADHELAPLGPGAERVILVARRGEVLVSGRRRR